MTVTNPALKHVYLGDDIVKPYGYTNKILVKTDVTLEKYDADGVITDLVVDVDYTVTGVGDDDGGTILLTGDALATGETLVILYAYPVEQTLDFTNLGRVFTESHEAALDAIVYAMVVLREKLNRAVLVPSDDSVASTEYLAEVTEARQDVLTALAEVQVLRDEVIPLSDEIVALAAIDTELVALYAALASIITVAANIDSVIDAANNVPKSNFVATVAPTVNDDSGDGYQIGSYWIDTVGQHLYFAVSVAPGAAVWRRSDFASLQLEFISMTMPVVYNGDVVMALKMPYAGTITDTTTICTSGTCTATFKINTTALGGSANAVSTSEVSTARTTSNTFAAGDDIVVTISSNSSCLNASLRVQFNRTIA